MPSVDAIERRTRPPAQAAALRRRSPEEHARRIRPLLDVDRGQIVGILERTGVFSGEELVIARELIDTVLEKPDQRDYRIDVYDDEGRVLGYTCIGPTPGTEGTFDLYWIAVDPDLHGSGVGGALDRHVASTILAQGGRLVIAETSSRPDYGATRAFYRGKGYTELARIPGYYRQGDDMVIYGKYLVP